MHAALSARRALRGLFQRRLGRRLRAPFPDVPGNDVDPIEHGESYYTRMLDAIDAAERAIDVEMYLWDDDEVGHRFVEALVRAARRGVRVRVLADAQGALGALDAIGEVSKCGGDVRIFNPLRTAWIRRYVHRTHKKLLVLDGSVAFTGGAGFSTRFSRGRASELPWFDRMFEVRGPAVTQLDAVFESGFTRWASERPSDATVPLFVPPRASGPSALRVLRGWPDAREFRGLLIEAVRAARERVWIGTPYFIPPRALRKALYEAASRGADVRVVIPSLRHANGWLYHAVRARYGRWLQRGVHLHEFEPCFYHAKSFVADRTLALVGSSNLDSWSWRRNAELDLAITDAPTVDRIASLLEGDRARSREVTREEARVSSLVASVQQTIASRFENWL